MDLDAAPYGGHRRVLSTPPFVPKLCGAQLSGARQMNFPKSWCRRGVPHRKWISRGVRHVLLRPSGLAVERRADSPDCCFYSDSVQSEGALEPIPIPVPRANEVVPRRAFATPTRVQNQRQRCSRREQQVEAALQARWHHMLHRSRAACVCA
jgi:hypothetical protein